jgi:hypothetical protein
MRIHGSHGCKKRRGRIPGRNKRRRGEAFPGRSRAEVIVTASADKSSEEDEGRTAA